MVVDSPGRVVRHLRSGRAQDTLSLLQPSFVWNVEQPLLFRSRQEPEVTTIRLLLATGSLLTARLMTLMAVPILARRPLPLLELLSAYAVLLLLYRMHWHCIPEETLSYWRLNLLLLP